MAEIGQFSGLGMYDKGGKFEPTEENINAARAKALEEGKKYIGDATAFETFKDRLFDIPDATIALVSGTGETLSEFVLGLAKATLQGGQMATTTDPKRIEEIRKEPGFTSYFDQLNFPRTDIYDSKISGVTPTDLGEFTGKYIAPLPAAPLVAGAKIATTPVLKGIGQLSDDIIKSFTKGDSGFRASAGGKPGRKVGYKKPDPKMMDLNFILNSDPKKKEKAIDLLEKIRTGKISDVEASKGIESLFPEKSALYQPKINKTTTQFTKIKSDYLEQRRKDPKFEEDIYDIEVDSPNQPKPAMRDRTQEIIKLADQDVSMEPYAIKFQNAYSTVMGKIYPKLGNDFEQVRKTAKSIMKFNNRKKSEIDDLYLPPDGQSSVGADGVRTYVSRDGQTAKKSFEVDYNAGDWIKGKAVKHLRNIADSTGKPFSMVSREISKQNPYVAEKILEMRTFFDEDLGRAHFYGLDHVQAPRFGGTNSIDNLHFTMEGPHNALKPLTPDKTLSDIAIKNKSRMEDDVHKLAIKLVDNIAAGKNDEAIKISEKIKNITNDFANTYKKTDFQIGEPYVPIKTGDNTAEFVKYSDYLKLDSKSKNRISELLPNQFNKPNAGKSIEEQVDEVYTIYADIFNLGGPIDKKTMTQLTPMKDGGIVGISHLTRPL
jgi:hypothetical protein